MTRFARRFRLPVYLLVVLAGCEATVESGLTEQQANQVVVALHDNDIGAQKERDEGTGDGARYRVTVAPDAVAPALSVLRAAELPRRSDPGLEEVFGTGSLVPTATEERARYVAALGGELARSIEAIDGVLDARVHVAVPESRDFALDGEQPRPRASVLIKHRSGKLPYSPDSIRELVAGAVEGMEPGNVAVVPVAGSPPDGGDSSGLVHLGPIAVTEGSAPVLKGVLATAFGLHIVLAGCLVFVVMRRRRI